MAKETPSDSAFLTDVKTLRARERLPFRNHAHDGRDEVLTLQEVIDLAKRASAEFGRTIGIYPETKHPSHFRSIGLPLEEKLVAILKANGYDAPDAPCFIQSFEYGNLQALRTMISTPLVFLMEAAHRQPYDFVLAGDPRTYGDLTRPEELAKIARFAQGIGPSKRLIVPAKADRTLAAPTTLVADAHRAGLLVHPYTFRDEAIFLAPDYAGDPQAEYLQFFRLGVDAVVALLRTRIGDRPLYVSIDIDVLDPAHAPGTGTPEVAGISTSQLFEVLRGLRGLNIVGSDVVEVCPPYDHAGLTGLAAAHTA